LRARFRGRARVAMFTNARSASLTDFEFGKASANSGSSNTTLTPLRYLSTYFPRTPPEKSYSALIPLWRRLEEAFFVLPFFMFGCRTSADYADALPSHSMNHNEQALPGGYAHDHEPLFAGGVIPVRNLQLD